MTDEEWEQAKEELLAQAREIDRRNAERAREEWEREYGGLNFFQRIWKRLTCKKTLEEILDDFTIGL